MFLIFTTPFRIFTAETVDTLESTFCSDMRRADGRILEARSAYFRSMLSGGMKEASNGAPIDLGEDVLGEALHALLHFLHTDHFDPVTPPSRVFDMRDEEVLRLAKFALEVHT